MRDAAALKTGVKLGKVKLGACYASDLKHAEWWEAFIERCDKRALRHAELVPGKDHVDKREPQKGEA